MSTLPDETLSIVTFDKFWRLSNLNASTPMFDFANSEYDEWGSISGVFTGMRHKMTGREHGIVRTQRPSGGILDGTYNDGR